MDKIKGEIHGDGIFAKEVNVKNIYFGKQSTEEKEDVRPTDPTKPFAFNQSDARFKAFISFASEHETLAKFIKDFTETFFRDLSPCFISNDPRCIPAGKDWFKLISNALRTVQVLFVLACDLSLTRHWVNFEIGATWSREIPIIFLCYGGLTPTTLPLPYIGRQALLLSQDNSEDTLKKFVEHLEQSLNIRSEYRSFEMDYFAEQLESNMDRISRLKQC
jgi:hypothetical protein